MRLKKIELSGFKSFADYTVLNLDENICAVVGPNGCGKSNVVEAIKWLLGEQSAKQLRGEVVTDLIFGGTEKRGPHSMAEVTITFHNDDKTSHPAYKGISEISVTRRAFRDGTTQYEINKNECRLRDAIDLFLSAGTSSRSYSIIEQDKISALITATPEFRRTFIEEAAGISKYKIKKKLTEQKIEQTQQNLLRINDIINELEANLETLKRQSQKARRYLKYKEELKELSICLAVHQWLEKSCLINWQQIESVELNKTRDRIKSEHEEKGKIIEKIKVEINLKTQQLQNIQQILYQEENKLNLTENEIFHITNDIGQQKSNEKNLRLRKDEIYEQIEKIKNEKIELSEKYNSFEQSVKELSKIISFKNKEFDEFKEDINEKQSQFDKISLTLVEKEKELIRTENDLKSTEEKKEQLIKSKIKLEDETASKTKFICEIDEKLSQLSSGQSTIKKDETEIKEKLPLIEKEINQFEQQIKEMQKEVEILKSKKSQFEQKRKTLLEFKEQFAGYEKNIKQLFQNSPQNIKDNLNGIVAEFIDYNAEFEQALVAVLGFKLQYVIVKEDGVIPDIYNYLTNQKEKGNIGIIYPEKNSLPEQKSNVENNEKIKYLVQFVKADDKIKPILNYWIGSTVVAETWDKAVSLFREGFDSVVTLKGELIEKGAVYKPFASYNPTGSILKSLRELKEIEPEIDKLIPEINELNKKIDELIIKKCDSETQKESLKSKTHQLELSLLGLTKDSERLENEKNNLLKNITLNKEKIKEIVYNLEQIDSETAGCREDYYELRAFVNDAREKYDSIKRELTKLKSHKELHDGEMKSLENNLAKSNEEFRIIKLKIEHCQNEDEKLKIELKKIDEQDNDITIKIGSLIGKRYRLSEEKQIQKIKVKELKGDEKEKSEVIYNIKASLQANEAEIYSMQKNEAEIQEKINDINLSLEKNKIHLKNIEEKMQSLYNENIKYRICDYHLQKIPDGVQDRINELEGLLNTMGNVNLEAPQEYEKVFERYNNMKMQKEDLEKSIDNLKEAIAKMNEQSKILFSDAYIKINNEFKKIFPLVFGGGQASLSLTQPDNILETGVEIMVEPPGKRLKSVKLLSGGEKALAAISFMFSLIIYNSPPFCIMDEVDAPLDDANIDRFGKLLEQFSEKTQFIIVTHSPITMKIADVLYGITMPDPGVSKVFSLKINEAVEFGTS